MESSVLVAIISTHAKPDNSERSLEHPTNTCTRNKRPIQLALLLYRDLVSQLTAGCTAVGRDLRTLRKTWYGLCSCAPTEEAAHNALT